MFAIKNVQYARKYSFLFFYNVVIMEIGTIIFDIANGLLPSLLILSDSILTYVKPASKILQLITLFLKCVIMSLLMGYIAFLYFIRKQKTRTSSNLISLIIKLIVVILIMVTMIIIVPQIIMDIIKLAKK